MYKDAPIQALIKRYRAGEFNLSELADRIVEMGFKPVPYLEHVPTDRAEAMEYTERMMHENLDGTYDEIPHAYHIGLLTRGEFFDLVRDLESRAVAS